MKAPKVATPNPNTIISSQQKANTKNLQQMQAANQIGQQTPTGSLEYFQSGTDANGNPQYTARSQLTPDQQAILDQMEGSQIDVGTSLQGLIDSNFGKYGQSFDLLDPVNGVVNQRLGQMMEYMTPYWGQQTDELDNKLRNQGIMPGDQTDPASAYNNSMRALRDTQNQSYQKFLADFQPQAFQQAIQEHTLPLDLAQQMFGMTRPSGPSFVNTPTYNQQPANALGAYAQQQQAQQWNAQAAQANRATMINGLGTLAGTILGGPIGGSIGGGLGNMFAQSAYGPAGSPFSTTTTSF